MPILKFHAVSLLVLLAQVTNASRKPVKVFILSGQSNMVGAGKVDGGSSRWGNQFIDPVVSVIQGRLRTSPPWQL